MRKSTLFLIALIFSLSNVFGQNKLHLITSSSRVIGVHKEATITCIAYSSFDKNGHLIYQNCDSITKKYELYYEEKYNKQCKCYVTSVLSMPMQCLSSDGRFTIYNNETYWCNGKRIKPIEIITKPIIK